MGYLTDFDVYYTENPGTTVNTSTTRFLGNRYYSGVRSFYINDTDALYFKHRNIVASQDYGRMDFKFLNNTSVNSYKGLIVGAKHQNLDIEYGILATMDTRYSQYWLQYLNTSGTQTTLASKTGLSLSNLTWYLFELEWEKNGTDIDATANLYTADKTSQLGTLSYSYDISTYWLSTDVGIFSDVGDGYIDDFNYYTSR